jgi:hypothetical protein
MEDDVGRACSTYGGEQVQLGLWREYIKQKGRL